MNWLLYPPNHFGSTSGAQSLTASDYDAVALGLENIDLDGAIADNNGLRRLRADMVLTRSASGNLNNPFQVVGDSGREGSRQFTQFVDSEGSRPLRSLSRSDTL